MQARTDEFAGSADRGAAWLCGYAVFLACIQVITIATSLANLRLSTFLARSVLAVSFLGGCLAYCLVRRGRVERPGPPGPSGRRWVPALAVALPAAAVYVALWVLACRCPDLSCDGNTYHIPGVHLWAVHGNIYWIDPNFQEARFMNGYPKGVEVMSFVLATALGANCVTAANVAFLPLGVLGIGCLSRLLGAARPMSMLAGAAFVLIPVNISQAATTYTDSAFASCAAAFFASLVFAARGTGEGERCAPAWQALPALGASAGLVIAGKGTGALMAVLGLAVLAAALALKALRAGSPRRAMAARAAGFLLAASGIAVLVGGFWHIRDYVITGNPIYPVRASIAGHELFPGLDLGTMIGFEETAPEVFRHWPWYLKVPFVWAQIGQPDRRWPDTMWFLDSRLGGLGYVWLLGCLPAVLAAIGAAIVRPTALRRQAFLLLLASVGLTFVLWPMNWWARYTLWLYACGLPCLALAGSWLWRPGRPPAAEAQPDPHATAQRAVKVSRTVRALRVWFLAAIVTLLGEGLLALALNIAWAKCPHLYSARLLLPALVEQKWDRPVCYRMPELGGTVFDTILTGGDAVAVGRMLGQQPTTYNIEMLGRLSQPIGRRPLIALPEQVDDSTVESLRAQHVRYVVWDALLSPPEPLLRASAQADRCGGFVVLTMPQDPS